METDLQKQCNAFLRENDVLFYHKEKGRSPKQHEHQAGLPDICIWHDGDAMFIELKTKTGSMREAQLKWMQKAQHEKIPYCVCTDFAMFKRALKHYGIIK